MSAGHGGKYEAMVAADTAEEAIAVAAEALPRGAELVKREAVSAKPGIWQVKLTFRGGKRATVDPIE